MRTLSVILICLLTGAFAWLGASAQEPGAGAIWFQHRQFNIPFKKDPRDPNVTSIRLYRSSDQGRSWNLIATAAPEEQFFHVNVPQDGSFWFGIQTVDKQGKTFPAAVEDLRPGMKLIVDTVPPTVAVQALPPRGGEVGVSWSVRDDNLDLSLPDAVRVEYRLVGGMTWIPLTIAQGSNQHFWNPQTNALVEVRVTARDRAGNVGQERTTVNLAGGVLPQPGLNNPPSADASVKDIDRKFVNGKKISLSYDLKEVGPSGVSAIELWYTLYKVRSWTKLEEYPVDVNANQPKKLAFDVQEEGIYGITLVAKSGVGLGDQPPKVGDRPQFWIEVDLTKPIVQIGNVAVGSGLDKGKLTVNWSAQDKNLGPNPIRLSYAKERDGQWNPIADKLGNAGRYVWRMPDAAELPYQFYLKVEATDLAGNIGEAITQEKVKVDLSTPKAKILEIEAGGR